MAKTYDTYKDSGIAWIGKIPEKWIVGLVGKYFEEVNKPNINQEETNTLQFKMGEIISKSKGDSKYSPETIEAYNVVEPGTIMMNGLNLSFDLVSQRVAQVRERGAITSTYLAIFPTKEMTSDYAKYLLKAYDNNKALHAMGRGLRATLSYKTFRSEPIIVPSLDEQQAIASYLDEKCSEIDSLVSLQEEMISELQAYKQSIITEAVTKGLDSNVPMKDSGVVWIGEMPAHWNLCKLKMAYTLLNGRAYSDVELLENGKYRILRVGNLFTSDKWYYSNLELEQNKYCEDGDLLYAWSASIGPYLWKQEKVIYHYHIWKVLFKPNDLIFSYYLLDAITQAKQKDMHGSAMQHLTKSNMDNSYICLPPLSEQQAIASYLDEKTSQIDSLIAIKQEKITELKDYKKSIIYEYVTGKKKV